MDADHVSVSDGILTLTAEPVSGEPSPIHYLPGAIHAKSTFAVEEGGRLDLNAEFMAPVSKGTWPELWLNAASGWLPEIDIAEWKGSGKVSFNTFNTSSEVTALDLDYSDPRDWHSVKADLRDENGSDVSVKLYLDGELVTTQYVRGYVGQRLRLIINYQTEGSSGSPGPSTKEAVPYMKSGSTIIFISTDLADSGSAPPELLLYVSTKSALNQMTRIMAKELATQGIRVNAISPGATGTELFNKTNSVDTIQKIASGNPFNRTADPDEIAEAVSLLWKNESRWITGQVVKVDGGSA